MTENNLNLSTLSRGTENNLPGPVGFTPRPGQLVCGDIDIRIDSQGLWHYLGSPIGRTELVKLFATVLRRDDNGDHWLITPAEMCRVKVEDAAFMAVSLSRTGQGRDQIISFQTNIDKTFVLSDQYPLRIDINPATHEPAPYIALDHQLEAKLTRPVFYELVELAELTSQNLQFLVESPFGNGSLHLRSRRRFCEWDAFPKDRSSPRRLR